MSWAASRFRKPECLQGCRLTPPYGEGGRQSAAAADPERLHVHYLRPILQLPFVFIFVPMLMWTILDKTEDGPRRRRDKTRAARTIPARNARGARGGRLRVPSEEPVLGGILEQ
jgi:hypothetical protein